MRFEIFSVFDKQVNAYMQPFFCRSKGEAIRSFTDAVNDGNKPFGKYASDYSLMSMGVYDDNNGSFMVHDPVRVIGAHEVIADDVLLPDTQLTNGNNVKRMPM